MILALDIGNTRLKWGWHADGRWRATGALPVEELDALPTRLAGEGAPDTLIISNVAGEAIAARLAVLLAPLGVAPVWAQAWEHQCGVRNGYREPARLGSDRWAALIAARARHPGPCLVVNAGTAVTVDALDADGLFLGGLILPGLRPMRKALSAGTAALPDQPGEVRDFPTDTADAIATGLLAALAGAVLRQHGLLAARCGAAPHLLISGGDGARLAAALPLPVEWVDNLVLEGLVRIATP